MTHLGGRHHPMVGRGYVGRGRGHHPGHSLHSPPVGAMVGDDHSPPLPPPSQHPQTPQQQVSMMSATAKDKADSQIEWISNVLKTGIMTLQNGAAMNMGVGQSNGMLPSGNGVIRTMRGVGPSMNHMVSSLPQASVGRSQITNHLNNGIDTVPSHMAENLHPSQIHHGHASRWPAPPNIGRPIEGPGGRQEFTDHPQGVYPSSRGRGKLYRGSGRGILGLEINDDHSNFHSNSTPPEDHGNGVADEYDPAEPTDDSSKNATKRDRPGSPHGSDGHTHSPWMDQGELKVTLYDDRRAVSQDGPTQPKRRKFGPTPGSMHPHDHPHGHMMMSSPPENPPGQDSHLPGQEPVLLPPGYLPPYHHNNYQEMQRIKAHEHLRKIEQSYEKESFCNICDRPFSGPLIQHRQTEEHKRKLRLTTRGCRLCRTGSFTKYPDYVKHIDSEAHKKRKEELHRHVQQARPDRDEDEEHPHDDHHDNEDMHYPEDMVTVDATGIYEADQSKQDGSLNAHASPRMPNQHMSSIRTPNHLDVSPVHQPPSPAVPSHSPDQSTPIPQASTSRSQPGHTTHRKDPPPMLSYSPITVAPSPADSFDESQDFTNIKTEPLDGAPSYQNDNPMPIGQEYIVPKTGFFCRLCQKFYFKEEVAMNNHCASRTHFDNYVNANRAKLEVDDESMQNTDASFMPR